SRQAGQPSVDVQSAPPAPIAPRAEPAAPVHQPKPTAPSKPVLEMPKATAPAPPTEARIPFLYQPLVPINAADLRAELERPWTTLSPAPAGPTFRVSRLQPRSSENAFDSLAAACAAAPADRETVIEIHDNGPLFEPPIAVTERSLAIRPGKGYRSLLAWDVTHAAAGITQLFLSVSGGLNTLHD